MAKVGIILLDVTLIFVKVMSCAGSAAHLLIAILFI